MNLYVCSFNTGADVDFDAVVLRIAAPTRGAAKAYLLSAAQDAGFQVDFVDPMIIRVLRKDVDIPEGVVEDDRSAP